MGPAHTMHVAEKLYRLFMYPVTRYRYISGYLSYPRTESTQYPSGFDFIGTLKSLQSSESW